jgi:Lon protease-like protein
MFPLGTVLFPGGVLPLHVFEPRYREMVWDCLRDGLGFGVVLISRGREVGGGDQRVGVGTEARIDQAAALPDGRWALLAVGHQRIAIDSWLPEAPYPRARVRNLSSGRSALDDQVVADVLSTIRRVRALMSELGEGRFASGVEPSADGDDAEQVLWNLCDAAPLGPLDRQRLLDVEHVTERTRILTDLMMDVEADVLRLLAEGGRS